MRMAPDMPLQIMAHPTIEPIAVEDKDLLRNLMQAYRHDMSEFNGDKPDESGSFGVGNYFDVYWIEAGRHPLKISVSGQIAGFALVRQLQSDSYSMSEFFILRSYRRTGIGRQSAMALFDRFKGTWHVAQDESNEPSQRFWCNIIKEYTGNKYEQTWSDHDPRGPMQVFESKGA